MTYVEFLSGKIVGISEVKARYLCREIERISKLSDAELTEIMR